MPIENIDLNTKMQLAVKQEKSLYSEDNVIVAGTLKVKHSFIDETMLLYGFIVEDNYFDLDKFKVKGMKISYDRSPNNDLIYVKLVVNSNSTSLQNLNLSNVNYRHGSGYSPIKAQMDKIYKFLLYENTLTNQPECVANNIFAVCKYRKNEETKYFLSGLHELVPVLD